MGTSYLTWVSVKRGLRVGVGVGVGIGVSFFFNNGFFSLSFLFLKPNSDFLQFASAVHRCHQSFTISAVYSHEKVANI